MPCAAPPVPRKHYRDVKKALKKSLYAEPFMASRYAFSPYMACQHGCKYCDGRAERYFVEGEFEQDIVVRKNLPALLSKELDSYREKAIISAGSGISDPYQPIEKEELIMRDCAELLAQHDFPVSVMTKSSLVQRDIDVWGAVHARRGFMLIMSLTFADDSQRSLFEPYASPVEERIATLREFKKRGMHTGVLMMPLLPFISDTEDNISHLVKRLKEIGVDFIIPGGLTLRPGRQKELFLSTIETHYPALLSRYRDLYRENRPSGAPLRSFGLMGSGAAGGIVAAAQIPTLIPHYIFKNKLPVYDEISVLLNHMGSLYAQRGIAIGPLRKATDAYTAWLIEEKKKCSRQRNSGHLILEKSVRYMIESGAIDKHLGNAKLSAFIREVVVEGKTFDYCTLALS